MFCTSSFILTNTLNQQAPGAFKHCEMILEFADALNFTIANTWFKKEEERLITNDCVVM